MTMDKYPEVKTEDRVLEFSYWNSPPRECGLVVAQTDHFVEIETKGFLSHPRKWISKENIEVVRV